MFYVECNRIPFLFKAELYSKYVYIIFCWFNDPLMDIRAASTSWLLWLLMLRTLVCVDIISRSYFESLWIYTLKWDCYFYSFEKPPYCFPKQLHDFTVTSYSPQEFSFVYILEKNFFPVFIPLLIPSFLPSLFSFLLRAN